MALKQQHRTAEMARNNSKTGETATVTEKKANKMV